MTATSVIVGAPVLLALMSIIGHRLLSPSATLPMQWDAAGRPTWTAPRRVALAFIPTLCALVMVALAATRVGAASRGTAVVLFVAAVFVAAHLFYLVLACRSGG